jgi:hypothetical protein
MGNPKPALMGYDPSRPIPAWDEETGKRTDKRPRELRALDTRHQRTVVHYSEPRGYKPPKRVKVDPELVNDLHEVLNGLG